LTGFLKQKTTAASSLALATTVRMFHRCDTKPAKLTCKDPADVLAEVCSKENELSHHHLEIKHYEWIKLMDGKDLKCKYIYDEAAKECQAMENHEKCAHELEMQQMHLKELEMMLQIEHLKSICEGGNILSAFCNPSGSASTASDVSSPAFQSCPLLSESHRSSPVAGPSTVFSHKQRQELGNTSSGYANASSRMGSFQGQGYDGGIHAKGYPSSDPCRDEVGMQDHLGMYGELFGSHAGGE
jgi:hypothetical protein